MSVLLLSAACATQALANYFYNPYTNIGLNIGSAPSPTPRDIRENRLPKVAKAPAAPPSKSQLSPGTQNKPTQPSFSTASATGKLGSE